MDSLALPIFGNASLALALMDLDRPHEDDDQVRAAVHERDAAREAARRKPDAPMRARFAWGLSYPKEDVAMLKSRLTRAESRVRHLLRARLRDAADERLRRARVRRREALNDALAQARERRPDQRSTRSEPSGCGASKRSTPTSAR